MAEGRPGRRFNLEDVRQFEEFRDRMDGYADTGNLRGAIRTLRLTPASDREKKRELARFFQYDAGTRFNEDDRRLAYIAILGVRTNRQIG